MRSRIISRAILHSTISGIRIFVPAAISIVLYAGASSPASASVINPVRLICEYRINPLGIDETEPRLSWQLESLGRGHRQSAYQIVVSNHKDFPVAGNGTLWDTGKVLSSKTSQIKYDGEPLQSGSHYYWRVRVWDEDGSRSQWSSPAFWSMGLLKASEWRGEWIGRKLLISGSKESNTVNPPAYLRREITSKDSVQRAMLYVTAMGLFEIYINGKRIGEDIFTPGWSSYNKRIYYHTYDVTKMLLDGRNAIGAILADGWYAGYVGFIPKGRSGRKRRGLYGDVPALLLQVQITYTDGTTEIIASDSKWLTSSGPILKADILMGETYDARMEMPGWNMPGFDDSDWRKISSIRVPHAKLRAYPATPVRATEVIEPVSVIKLDHDTYVFDMGQNFAGRIRLTVSGKAGDKLTIRHGEMLRTDGTLMTENLRSAEATDTYILKGDTEEIWEPRFTYHGFRYVQVAGYPATPTQKSVTGIVLSSALPVTGRFTSSSDVLNRLFRTIMWTQRSNFLEIPTDCPQRDERLGWAGDVQLFSGAAAYNMDIAAFLTKWLDALADDQRSDGAYPDFAPMPFLLQEPSPGWMDAGIIVPHLLYRIYGDKRIIKRHYPSMKRFLAYLEGQSVDSRLKVHQRAWGDWKEVGQLTSRDVIATAFFAYDAKLMSEMAQAIGENSDADYYSSLFEQIKKAFMKAFVSPSGNIESDTQTVYALALYMDLLDEPFIISAGNRLLELLEGNGWHLSTGYVGTRFLLPVLSQIRRPEIALRLLLNQGFPSWGFFLNNGATTLWERWDAYSEKAGMRNLKNTSFNHYVLGSVGEWLFSSLAGIKAASPGFTDISIQPTVVPGAIGHVRAEYRSMVGDILSDWTVKGDTLRLQVSIPTNTRATVRFPSSEPDGILESNMPLRDGDGVLSIQIDREEVTLALGSGSYDFKTKLPESVLLTRTPEEFHVTDINPEPAAPWQ